MYLLLTTLCTRSPRLGGASTLSDIKDVLYRLHSQESRENQVIDTHTDLKALCCKFVILCFTLVTILRQGRLETLNCDMFVNFMEHKFSAENYVD